MSDEFMGPPWQADNSYLSEIVAAQDNNRRADPAPVRVIAGESDDEWGDVPADELEAEYENQLRKHQVGVEELKAWRPVKKARGRKSAKRIEPDSE